MTMPTSRAAGIAPGFATDTLTHGAPNSRTTMRPTAVASAFDHLILRGADELDQPLRELLVVQGAGDAVARRGDARVRADLEIDADDLLDAAFPLPETDDRLDPKLAKKDLVHWSP